jgi:3-oxoacyl-[acyl-carrier-protein] synthase II
MSTAMRERVVVTGAGTVSPLATGLPGTWAALASGRSGVREIPGLCGRVRIGADAAGFDGEAIMGERTARMYDRYAQMALVAAEEARTMAGLLDHPGGDRWGTVIGTGLGGIASHERGVQALAAGRSSVSAYMAVAMVPSAATAAVALAAAARGPALSPATACASGTDAIGLGADMIRAGRADVVLAGGADAPITASLLSAFAAMGAAAPGRDDPATACRPFAADRAGLVLGEGAAVMVLESAGHARRRGAEPLAEVLGYAATNDAHHLSAPSPDGGAAAAAVDGALRDAAVPAAGIGYVNAHGTGTRHNDRIEARVLAAAVGDRVPVSATKSMTGHLMGAAGALEAAICVQVLRTGLMPATQNCDQPDPDCGGLDLLRGQARRGSPRLTLSTSFGFGGHNAALVLGQP